VIPLYNGQGCIRRSIQSVLGQTYSDFELLVIDDGSTDGGPEIVRTFTDSRIRLIQQENAGASVARNRGIAEARSEYVAFLDADDEWDPPFLDAVVHLSVAYPRAGILATGYRKVFPMGPSVEITVAESRALQIDDYFRRLQGGSIVHASAVALPARVFQELGGFQEGYHCGDDQEMWARVALRYSVGYDPRILSSFHQRGRQPKRQSRNPRPRDLLLTRLQTALNATPANPPAHNEDIRRLARRRFHLYLWQFALDGDRRAALEFLDNSGAQDVDPLLARAYRAAWLWPALCLWAQVLRLARSRPFLRLRGGQRILCGVIQRLSTPA